MRKLYCTLDTETLQGIKNPMLAYNIAGIIHDRLGNVIAVFNYLVAELFEQIRYDDYAKKNFPKYVDMINSGEITLVATVADAVEQVRKLLDFYNVGTVMAYNANFDLRRGACAEIMEGRELIDTWLTSLETICQKKSYAKFCADNDMINKKSGVCRTGAEQVFAYLTNNAGYAEEHTAMEDCKIEMQIFLACVKTHKKMTRNACTFDDSMKGAVKWPRP